MESVCPKFFEHSIFHMMNKSGLSWDFVDVNLLENEKFVENKGKYLLNSSEYVDGLIPSFSEMSLNALYYSLKPNHKAIEAILKLNDKVLVFQMKWSDSKIYVDFDKLGDVIYETYNVPEGTAVTYCLFTKPGKNDFDEQEYFII